MSDQATVVRSAPPAAVLPVKLSDGSIADNVYVTVPGTRCRVILAATDEHHALRLRDEINACFWVEHGLAMHDIHSPALDALTRSAMAVGASAGLIHARRLLIQSGQREAADILLAGAPALVADVVERQGVVTESER